MKPPAPLRVAPSRDALPSGIQHWETADDITVRDWDAEDVVVHVSEFGRHGAPGADDAGTVTAAYCLRGSEAKTMCAWARGVWAAGAGKAKEA